MRKLVTALAMLGMFLSTPALAGTKASDCKSPECKAWQSGNGARPGPPTRCIIKIGAPAIAGKVGLDVRDDSGKSRWGAPRIKRVGAGRVTYGIGCNWLDEMTEEVYLCVEGSDGVKQYYSRRLRSKGELATVLRTRTLEMCLLGPDCPGYVSR